MRITVLFLFLFFTLLVKSQNILSKTEKSTNQKNELIDNHIIHAKDSTETEIKETIDWLNEKVQEFQINGKMKAEYDLSFDKLDNDYYLKVKEEFYSYGKDKGVTSKSVIHIPIKEIGRYYFNKRGSKWQDEDERWYLFKINIRNDNHKIIGEKDYFIMGTWNKKPIKESSFIIHLSTKIDDENLQERIRKSIKYLKDLTDIKKEEKF